MKASLLVALVVLGCASAEDIDASWQPVGPAQYAISECQTSECLRAAVHVCPYGYDRLADTSDGASVTAEPSVLGGGTVRVRREKTLLVQCHAPKFCETEACAYGYRCTSSRRYPGRNVCAAL